jgi:hypothetical protein
MFQISSLIDSDTRIATAAVIAGLIVSLTVGLIVVLTPDAPNAGVAAVESSQPFASNDRPTVLANRAACSQHGWPNYPQSCLFDKRASADDVRKVRIVDLERR